MTVQRVYPCDLTDWQVSRILERGSAGLERDGIELMHEDTGPGKFEGNANPGLTEAIYNRSLEGWADDRFGSVDETGYYAELLGRFILVEDDRGFVSTEEYPSIAEAEDVFRRLG